MGANSSGGYNITDSLRFRSSASAYLNRTPTTAGNRKTFTISCWVKRSKLGATQRLFQAKDSASGAYEGIEINSSDQFKLRHHSGAFYEVTTNQVFRDTSAWYHLVATVDTTQATSSNRIKLYVNGEQVTSFATASYPAQNYDFPINDTQEHTIGTYPTGGGEFFDGYMTEVNFVDGQALTPSDFGEYNTDGVWSPKKYTGTYGTNGFYLPFNSEVVPSVSAGFGGTASNALYDDTAYLISNTTTGSSFQLIEYDFGESINMIDYNIQDLRFTGGTSTFKIYTSDVGGSLSNYTERASLSVSSSYQNYSGNLGVTARYIQIRAVAFGTNGQGQINYFNVDVDANNFSDNSGNANNWTPNNINLVADITSDVPTPADEDTGNFATLNPLDMGSLFPTVSEANLKFGVSGNSWTAIRATIGVSSGKWYWEITPLTAPSNNWFMNGIKDVTESIPAGTSQYVGFTSGSYGYYSLNGKKYNNASSVSYGAAYGVGDVIGVALDIDAGTLTFYKNNVSQGVAYSGLTGTFAPAFSLVSGVTGTENTEEVNFGQRPFKYTPPTGYKKLNTYNLPDSSITDGSQYMNAVLYTGNSSTNAITGVGFSPDFTWIKRRSGANAHQLYDTVRGAGYVLKSDSTNAEAVETAFNSFDSDGFEVDGGSGSHNLSGESYVAWNWRGSDSTAVSNTDGTITSTVSANTTSGFSVVTYTGNGTNSTVGHGLGSAPKVLISKNRSSAINWGMYHDSLGATKFMRLNTTDAVATSTAVYPTAPDASVFYVGTGTGVNTSGDDYVFYCFAEVEGFSKFGSFVGNGQSVDGPFIYTGFRPAFVLFKRTGTASWNLIDSARTPYNNLITASALSPNDSDAESTDTTNRGDLLSNGFRVASGSTSWNLSGSTYIYMAFAENPFKNSLAR